MKSVCLSGEGRQGLLEIIGPVEGDDVDGVEQCVVHSSKISFASKLHRHYHIPYAAEPRASGRHIGRCSCVACQRGSSNDASCASRSCEAAKDGAERVTVAHQTG